MTAVHYGLEVRASFGQRGPLGRRTIAYRKATVIRKTVYKQRFQFLKCELSIRSFMKRQPPTIKLTLSRIYLSFTMSSAGLTSEEPSEARAPNPGNTALHICERPHRV